MNVRAKLKARILGLPAPVAHFFRERYQSLLAWDVHRFDRLSFERNRFRGLRGASQTQLEAKLTFHAHSVEKGLSHEDLRLGFGEAALREMAGSMLEYRRQALDEGGHAFSNALSVLREYLVVHADSGYDTSFLIPLFGESILSDALACRSRLGGVDELHLSGWDSSSATFEEVFRSRRSVRVFADRAVSLDRVREALSLAAFAPSVCNRQASRAIVITDGELAARVLDVQGGFHGYPTPPALIAVVSDMSAFLSPVERNQPFVDGGLFAMSVVLGLEAQGFATCFLNAMLTKKKEQALRGALNMGLSERIVVFVAFGERKSRSLVPRSFRFPAEVTSRFIE